MFKLLFVSLFLLLALANIQLFSKDIIDISGRKISIPEKVDRIILADGRQIFIIAALESKQAPFKRIVGIGSDFRIYDTDTYQKYLKNFNRLKDIPETGTIYKNDFNLEFIASLNPQVIFFNLQYLKEALQSNLIEKLEKLNIASIFIDFRQDPIKNTISSIHILGQVLSTQEKADKLIKFYKKNLDIVEKRIKNIPSEDKPLVFIESSPGYEKNPKEYKTYGNVNMGQFIEIAGGKNLASNLPVFQDSFSVKVSPEFVLANKPNKIILTGNNWASAFPDGDWIPLGYYTQKSVIQKKIANIIKLRSGWDLLKAVQDKQIYTIYHQFYNSPYHFIAILQFAKWFHPQKFQDIYPEKIFESFHDEFLPIKYSGFFWSQLE